jgi:hypothetical protein
MVDLAGSEKISFQENFHDSSNTSSIALDEKMKRLKQETKNINTSLLALRRVIDVLSKSTKPNHVPYRASVLTKILKET